MKRLSELCQSAPDLDVFARRGFARQRVVREPNTSCVRISSTSACGPIAKV